MLQIALLTIPKAQSLFWLPCKSAHALERVLQEPAVFPALERVTAELDTALVAWSICEDSCAFGGEVSSDDLSKSPSTKSILWHPLGQRKTMESLDWSEVSDYDDKNSIY